MKSHSNIGPSGSRLHLLRTEKNISINELGRLIDVSPSTILRYEKSDIRNIGIDKLVLLSKIFNCDPGYIAGWQDVPRLLFPDASIIKRFDQLDDADRLKVEGYVEALLSDKKYFQQRKC